MIEMNKWRVAVLCGALVACTGQDVPLGGSGARTLGQAPTTGEVSVDGSSTASGEAGGSSSVAPGCVGGCGPSERCCIVATDVSTCATTAACVAAPSCPPVACEPSPTPPTSDASAGELDAAPVTTEADGGTTVGLCGDTACQSGQDCCIVTLDVTTCVTGLQCVWGGCPPALCDAHGDL